MSEHRALPELRFQALFKGLPLSAVVFQQSGDQFILTDYNRAALAFTQGKMPEYVGRSAHDLFHARPDVLQVLTRAFDGKTTDHLTASFDTLSTGPGLVLSLTFTYIPPDLVLLIAQDITERERAQRTVRLQADQYATLLATSSDGFWLFDTEGKLLDANDTYCRMSGYTRGELLTLHISDLEARESPQDVARHIQTTMQEGFERFESQHRAKDGRVFDVEISASFWPAAGQFLLFARDITARKQAEAELDRHRHRLEELVAERARELQVANAQLQAEILEHKRVERILQASEKHYRQLIELLPDGVLVHCDGIVEFVNTTGARILGFADPKELVGTSIFEIIHPDYAEIARERIRAVNEQSVRTPLLEQKYVRKDGSNIIVHVTAIPFHVGGKRTIQVVFSDITERREAEEKLADHAANLQLLSASATHMLAALPPAELFDYAAEQLQTIAGRSIIIVSEYDATTNQTTVRAAAAPAQKRQKLVPLLGRDPVGLTFTVAPGTLQRMVGGNLVPVEGGLHDLTFSQMPLPLCQEIERELNLGIIYAMPFVLGSDFMGTVAVLTDRTEGLHHSYVIEALVNQIGLALKRNRAEVENARLVADLQKELQERTQAERAVRELNRSLEHRTVELTSANQELDAFSYSVSHDLRGPLASIKNFARLLTEEHGPELPQGGQLYLELIRENAAAMTSLVEGLLSFSRSSRQPLRKQTVMPQVLVREALDDLREAQAGRHVEIVIGDLPPCEADPILLKQVYVNLLSNALKFTRARPVARIEVGSLAGDEASSASSATRHSSSQSIPGGPVTYFVGDNGVGFDMEQAQALFGVFQRLHHQEDFEGSGVGLAIVERIVRRHGGRIWADARVDQGARFYFTLDPTPAGDNP